MKFSQAQADVFVPGDKESAEAALARTTHLCIAAHQDDIEIMAHAGIADCHGRSDRAFAGVVVTDGAGSPRTGRYADYSDEQMRAVRREEQRKAALLGGYAVQLQLAHTSASVRQPGHTGLASDLALLFGACRPEVLYLHQPADKHDTHVGVLARCLEALRLLTPSQRPQCVLGCEVWRDLDWLADEDKVALDSGRLPELARSLLTVFDSQISGGKRYDLAVLGRRAANATFHQARAADQFQGVTWAMDLGPLLANDAPSLADFVAAHLETLRNDVLARLQRLG